MTLAIEAHALTKYYGTSEVVSGLEFEIPRGAIFGFLGPNGAGKSTTVAMLSTLVRPTAGSAMVAGIDVLADPFGVRRRISVVFQETTLDEELSCLDNLHFQAQLIGLDVRESRRRITHVLGILGLTASADVTVSRLSGGMRRRLEIARGILTQPEVLFLDEPTTGLDAQTRRNVWGHLQTLRRDQDCTIFLTTHHLEEAEVCDEVAIIDYGELVAQGTPARLKSEVGSDRVSLVPDSHHEVVGDWLRAIYGEIDVRETAYVFRTSDTTRALEQIFRSAPFSVKEITVTSPSLDDVFLLHTGSAMRDREVETVTTDMIGGPA